MMFATIIWFGFGFLSVSIMTYFLWTDNKQITLNDVAGLFLLLMAGAAGFAFGTILWLVELLEDHGNRVLIKKKDWRIEDELDDEL